MLLNTGVIRAERQLDSQLQRFYFKIPHAGTEVDHATEAQINTQQQHQSMKLQDELESWVLICISVLTSQCTQSVSNILFEVDISKAYYKNNNSYMSVLVHYVSVE